MKTFKSPVCLLTGEKNYYFGLKVKVAVGIDEWTVMVQLLDEHGGPLSMEGFKSHLESYPDEEEWGEREVFDLYQGGMVESLKEELTDT